VAIAFSVEETAMPTRNVVLTAHHETVIEALVTSGRYQNASEVLRDGLRLVEAREKLEAGKLQALQAAAAQGFSDLDQGRYSDVSDDDLKGTIDRLSQLATRQARSAGR
jgi:antitoxin ParD1/3/4